ncbi:RNA polymerase sigma factor [Sulfuriflexus mobilis]|uniref:RNA polymerase sigma factor n=1 Tax=Sulfuriflexus mobilis TaxID=1811807 RepID=UPI000F838413|nr:sigma-70 family RNA polymerase sigma factor [Sulfuriflexus mobilis]
MERNSVSRRTSARQNKLFQSDHGADSEQRLLDDLAFGKHGAMQRLVLNYQSFLRWRCYMLVHGNSDEANDLFSQVIFKVYTERPERLREIRHIGGWLSRVAHNQHIDSLRVRQARERCEGNLAYLYETIGYQAPSPEQELLNSELEQNIRQAFESLPQRLRQAAHMRFFEGAPYEEIAAGLAISQANARKRIQEARKILSTCLRAYLEGSSKSRYGCVPLSPEPCTQSDEE